MVTTQEKYNKYLKGEMTKPKLLYELRRDKSLDQFITNLMSFDDSIRVLKNRGIITEGKKFSMPVTLDTVNPYEYSQGIEYELDLCYKSTPKFIAAEAMQKAQGKVLSNLGKDPNYYTKCIAEDRSKVDLASQADFGKQSSRSDVYTQVKGENFVDKKNAMKVAKKREESNVKDTFGKKEKAKKKKLNEAKMIYKNQDHPFDRDDYSKSHGSTTPLQNRVIKSYRPPVNKGKLPLDQTKYGNDPHHFVENIPAANTDVLPFVKVKQGDKAFDDSGEKFKVLATGNYSQLRRYDVSHAFDKFLSSDPSGIDATQLVALIDKDGNTFVRVYGTGGVYVYGNDRNLGGGINQEAVVVAPDSPEADPNRLKKYTDKGMDIKLDPRMKNRGLRENNMKLMQILKEIDADFEAEIGNKEIPQNETEIAEAKAAILPTVTKAGLHRMLDLDRDVAVKDGYIWVKVSLGPNGILTKDMCKALASDSKFAGVNPNSDTEATLIFNK